MSSAALPPDAAGGSGVPGSPEEVARRTALRLAGEMGSSLPALVEREFQSGDDKPPTTYEPATLIALAALLISISGLAWTIYREAQNRRSPLPKMQGRLC